MLETTVAGSLPKLAWLAEPEKLWAAWTLAGDALVEGQQDAALVWIKTQEDAGIDIVSDGEQFRRHFVHGFLEQIEGIDWQRMTTMGIRDNRYDAQVPTVTAQVRRAGSVHGAGAQFCRERTNHKLKFTLPGPMTICDTIADAHYSSRPEMAMAFASLLNEEARELEALGVDVIQFDEPAFNAFMDDVKEWGVEALHCAIDGLKCKSEWRQYEEIFPALNESRIDQVSLECANSKVPLSLIGILKDKEVLVGAIDVASLEIETPEQVAATLRAAMEFVAPERMIACTNCGLAPLPRQVAEGKLRALGAGAALLRRELT
jgi:5-methyltetrahydropteroyltriglutamate--homocysteine methyltransferase